MDSPTVPTPAPDEADTARVAETSLPPRAICRCGSVRPRYLNRALDAFVCPECGGYR